MDNWLVFLLVNVLLALVVGILGNFATGWFKSSYEKRLFFSRARKIIALKAEYREKKLLSEHLTLIAPFAIRDFILRLIAFIITSLFGVGFVSSVGLVL